MTGGLDTQALQKPREIFGAGRFHERGGSLTVIASILTDTGSKLDQVVFEEFKGTGNAELYLLRDLADKRIFPAVDIKSSGTRKEEKLRAHDEQKIVNAMRRGLARQAPQKALEALLERLKATQVNAEFLLAVSKSPLFVAP
jgi:transcription termination factor Rho